MNNIEKIKMMTFEKKIEYAKHCIIFINNYTKCADEAIDINNKDLAIEYLKLKSEIAIELADIYSCLLEEYQNNDLKAILTVLSCENDDMN
jgi:hypothetical protein